MISCNKKLKSAAKGFLCGMLLYLFMIFIPELLFFLVRLLILRILRNVEILIFLE